MPELTDQQINEIVDAVRDDNGLQYALGNRDGTFLMLALVIESAKAEHAKGVPFGTWISHMEAMLQEHRS